MADTLGKRNPFRYRGYVFDEETGLYYLRSLYYNSEWGRFNNCDALVISGTGLHVVRSAFEYCSNRTINHSAPNGKSPGLLTSIVNGINSVYQEVLGAWKRLTKKEKALAVIEPKEAKIVKRCQEMTDRIVFGGMRDGDKTNAF